MQPTRKQNLRDAFKNAGDLRKLANNSRATPVLRTPASESSSAVSASVSGSRSEARKSIENSGYDGKSRASSGSSIKAPLSRSESRRSNSASEELENEKSIERSGHGDEKSEVSSGSSSKVSLSKSEGRRTSSSSEGLKYIRSSAQREVKNALPEDGGFDSLDDLLTPSGTWKKSVPWSLQGLRESNFALSDIRQRAPSDNPPDRFAHMPPLISLTEARNREAARLNSPRQVPEVDTQMTSPRFATISLAEAQQRHAESAKLAMLKLASLRTSESPQVPRDSQVQATTPHIKLISLAEAQQRQAAESSKLATPRQAPQQPQLPQSSQDATQTTPNRPPMAKIQPAPRARLQKKEVKVQPAPRAPLRPRPLERASTDVKADRVEPGRQTQSQPTSEREKGSDTPSASSSND